MSETKDSYTSFYVAGAILDVFLWVAIIGAFYSSTLLGVILLGASMLTPNWPLPGELFREHARIQLGTDVAPPWMRLDPPFKTPPAPEYTNLVGAVGTARTALRPEGDVIIEGEVIRGRCTLGYIAAGTTIEVIEARPGVVIVVLEKTT